MAKNADSGELAQIAVPSEWERSDPCELANTAVSYEMGCVSPEFLEGEPWGFDIGVSE